MNRFLITHPDASFVSLCFGSAILSLTLSAILAFTL
jgi:hypothetical protein